MAHLVTDLKNLYETYFAKPYYIEPKAEVWNRTIFDGKISQKASAGNMQGREVFFPITLRMQGYVLEIPCATIRVNGQKTIVRTPVSERVGTVKEVYQVGDWQFTVKGVLIAPAGKAMPDDAMFALRQTYESAVPVILDNAISDLFLDTTQYVCLTALEFPEVEGKTPKCRPFTFTCESDYINSLIQQ